ncbi:V-type ATP synthase subunit E [Novipirellula aureliae]|uniref:V-type ATP synthase subunit E n=1 Tax=Novipirellula aureliae TaxID=2527966 RepID=A0A5C6E8G5_9BACT|nr:hypothetical protein [Novipirellula aureliae]TWU45098.1 V-type ATP synthase subunit E [Novipirellula aureliae]
MASTLTSDAANQSKSGNPVGVQELIDRLKSEGVAEGKQQAEALLADAKKQAEAVIEKADAEAQKILREAQHEADQIKNNGKLALALASRDANLHFKEQLEHEFRGWIANLVHKQLDKPDFLADLIREIANRTIASVNGEESETDKKLLVLVSDEPSAALDTFVQNQAEQLLREGVELRASRAVSDGFRVRLAEKNIEIDFTDEAVTAALMRFLAPKFRKIVELSSKESTNG